jgi:hypothetical protein
MYDHGMSEAAPSLSAGQLGAYLALAEVSSLLQYAVDEHLRIDGDVGCDLVAQVLPGHVDRLRHLLFEPLTGDDVTALSVVLGRVRDHMRAAPPRSAKPRARRNQTG